jgi:hypothetical protein
MSTIRFHATVLAGIVMSTIMALIPVHSFSQNGNNEEGRNVISGIAHYVTDNTHRILGKAENVIEEYLDSKDSLYIVPNAYNITIMPQYSYYFEYYRFSSGDKEQSITLMPRMNSKVGLYIGWKWLFLGYSINTDKGAPQKDFNFSFYTSKIGIDIFYRKRDKGYRIRSNNGFSHDAEIYMDRHKNFDGLTVRQKGFNLYYIFNNKRFSYPAAYSQTTIQRISAGSFILGMNYNEQSFLFDRSQLGSNIEIELVPELKFRKIEYKDFSINFGYTYNWVLSRNLLANISLTPAVGYKNTSLRLADGKDLLSNINFDFITRAAIVYNNGKYFAGASLISHTYSYRKEALSILNGFGVLNIYFGMYLWRKNTKH